MVRPSGAVKTTSIQVRGSRPLITWMSMDAPEAGSVITAVGPTTVKESVVATLPAPVVVVPLAVTSAFFTAPAGKLSV